jgi:hypothetical protein
MKPNAEVGLFTKPSSFCLEHGKVKPIKRFNIQILGCLMQAFSVKILNKDTIYMEGHPPLLHSTLAD